MSEGEDDLGVTPAKQRKPNEPENPLVVRQETEETNEEYEEVEEFVEPEVSCQVYLEPEVIIESELSVSTESVTVDNSQKPSSYQRSNAQNSSDDLDSDDDNEDIQNVKEIVIVSDVDSDNGYEEEECVGNDASDFDYNPDFYGSDEAQINVNMIQKILIRRTIDSDDDSFYEGDSEDSDDSLPPEWEIHVSPGGIPVYYHIPSGRVTKVRPRHEHQSSRDTRTMGYDDDTDFSDDD